MGKRRTHNPTEPRHHVPILLPQPTKGPRARYHTTAKPPASFKHGARLNIDISLTDHQMDVRRVATTYALLDKSIRTVVSTHPPRDMDEFHRTRTTGLNATLDRITNLIKCEQRKFEAFDRIVPLAALVALGTALVDLEEHTKNIDARTDILAVWGSYHGLVAVLTETKTLLATASGLDESVLRELGTVDVYEDSGRFTTKGRHAWIFNQIPAEARHFTSAL